MQIIRNAEQKIMGRFIRRGYCEEECKNIVGSKSRFGDVTVLNKRGFGQHSLKDFVKITNC